MGTTKKHLTWVGNLDRERSFEDEVKLARRVESEWTVMPSATEGVEPVWLVVVDPLPGWLRPLWACDRRFLYLRRPEGIWKVELPRPLDLKQVQLAIRSTKDNEPRGRMLLGWPDGYASGWTDDDQELVSLAMLDERRSTERWIGAEKADFIGSVYAHRPLACRKHASFFLNASPCHPSVMNELRVPKVDFSGLDEALFAAGAEGAAILADIRDFFPPKA